MNDGVFTLLLAVVAFWAFRTGRTMWAVISLFALVAHLATGDGPLVDSVTALTGGLREVIDSVGDAVDDWR